MALVWRNWLKKCVYRSCVTPELREVAPWGPCQDRGFFPRTQHRKPASAPTFPMKESQEGAQVPELSSSRSFQARAWVLCWVPPPPTSLSAPSFPHPTRAGLGYPCTFPGLTPWDSDSPRRLPSPIALLWSGAGLLLRLRIPGLGPLEVGTH